MLLVNCFVLLWLTTVSGFNIVVLNARHTSAGSRPRASAISLAEIRPTPTQMDDFWMSTRRPLACSPPDGEMPRMHASIAASLLSTRL